MILMPRITVPARRRNIRERYHMCRRTTFGTGCLYGGSSMISMGVALLSNVFLNTHAISNATTVPSRYMASNVSPASERKPRTVFEGMHAAINTVYTGSLAEQLMSGATRIVTNRSLGDSIVRVAMIPGIAHA